MIERLAQRQPGNLDRVDVTTPRVLVAEDNPAMLELAARRLRADGHEVIEASDGLELMYWADVILQRPGPVPPLDLIVTDLRMPVFSGQECLEYLRSRGDRTPVILLTAFGDERVYAAAYAAGVREVLDKPLDFGRLSAAVAQALAPR